MLGLCASGHLTGQKKCWCGKPRYQLGPKIGTGSVNVDRKYRPRDENGLNALDAVREATRIGGGSANFKITTDW